MQDRSYRDSALRRQRLPGEDCALVRSRLAEEHAGSWSALARPGMSGTVLTAMALAMLSQACRINVIIYHGSLVFVETPGRSAQAALGVSGTFGSYAPACSTAAWLTRSRIPEMRGQELERARGHGIGGNHV